MKQLLLCSILAACAAMLAACGDHTSTKDLGKAISLDLQDATEVSGSDNHCGLNGDGISCHVYDVNRQDTLDQITQDARWKPLPLDKTAKAILRDHDFTGMGLDLKKAVPEIQEGFYLLLDRHARAKDEPDLLRRASLNLTLALYDSRTGRLYIVEIDT